jgi:hypothetical protein
MSATIKGDGVSDVISQPAPASCIQVPMFEATEAIQRARKSGWRKGLQAGSFEIADCCFVATLASACCKFDPLYSLTAYLLNPPQFVQLDVVKLLSPLTLRGFILE